MPIDSPEADRVRLSIKLIYGSGQFAEGVKNAAFATFVLLYYNQVLGLSGTLAGLAIFIALCFDAITDPVVGSISDNFKSRWGRRHPFMYAAAIPMAFSFYFLFAPPEELSSGALFAWMTVFTVLVRGSMTLYYVPHLALGAELSDHYTERTSIVATAGYFLSSVTWQSSSRPLLFSSWILMASREISSRKTIHHLLSQWLSS